MAETLPRCLVTWRFMQALEESLVPRSMYSEDLESLEVLREEAAGIEIGPASVLRGFYLVEHLVVDVGPMMVRRAGRDMMEPLEALRPEDLERSEEGLRRVLEAVDGCSRNFRLDLVDSRLSGDVTVFQAAGGGDVVTHRVGNTAVQEKIGTEFLAPLSSAVEALRRCVVRKDAALGPVGTYAQAAYAGSNYPIVQQLSLVSDLLQITPSNAMRPWNKMTSGYLER